VIFTGSHLKKLRTEAGLTEQQRAQLVGVAQVHIAKIENSKVDPRLSTVNKILQVLTEGEGRKCKDIMTRNVIFAKPADRVLEISKMMMKEAISQLPVMQNEKIIGTVTEESIIKNLHINIADETLEKIMEPPLPCVPKETSVNMIRPLLEDNPGVLVMHKGDIVGIITRSDLLKTVSKTS
jgi:predicted transcriptional regulator